MSGCDEYLLHDSWFRPQEHIWSTKEQRYVSRGEAAAGYWRAEQTREDYLLPDHWITSEEQIYAIVRKTYASRVVELLSERSVRSALDVGCGDGWNCGWMVRAGMQVAGVDRSRNAIEHARRLVPEGRFLQGDVRDDKFTAEFPDLFDAAILVEVLEHIPPGDCVAALRNIASCVKPGGVLVLTTPSTNIENTNPQHYRHFTVGMLGELVAEAGGLQIITAEGYGDHVLAKRYYRIARFVDNRYYLIRPLRRWLQTCYGRRCRATPIERCEGIVMAMECTGAG